MTYTKFIWTEYTAISAFNMNHFETQYNQFVIDYGSHNHDDKYYTKPELDARFFSSSFMGLGSGFDADMLDGSHSSNLVAAALPTGAIMMWASIEAIIPDGWYICTGATHNGHVTPDLRDRFVIGAGDSFSPGDTGGSNSFTPTGAVNIAGHQLATSEIPSHAHNYTEYYSPSNRLKAAYGGGLPKNTSTTRSTNTDSTGDEEHGHAGSTIAFNSQDARPPYYALFYIMKCE
jgi:hypothetical protein